MTFGYLTAGNSAFGACISGKFIFLEFDYLGPGVDSSSGFGDEDFKVGLFIGRSALLSSAK